MDLETTNLEKGSALNPANSLVLWCARHSNGARGSGDSSNIGQLIKWIEDCDFIVAHNAKFELQWLQRHGLKPGWTLVFDTMLAEKVLAGNRRMPFDLDEVASRYGLENKEEIVKAWIHGGVCPSEIPPQRLKAYCDQDVDITFELFRKQLVLLEERKLLPIVFTRCLTCMVLSDIEKNGMFLDKEAVEKEYHKTLVESRNILGKIHDETGGINLRSPKQVGEFLYDNLGFQEICDYKGNPLKTDGGARRTDEPTIAQLKARTPAQKRFLELYLSSVPYKKALDTLTKFHECAQAGDLLYFNFNQHIAVTHRLSSNGRLPYKVQGQNIDRAFKALFKARKDGWVIGDVDFAQLEFRGAGHLGRDAQIKEDIAKKWDVHRHTASVLFKKAHSEISKKERTDAKPRTFAPLFFSTSGTADERRYNEEFRKRYKEVNKTQTDWTYEVLANKKLVTETGLILYWPDCKLSRNNYITYSTEIANAPIQMFCGAEIVPIALVHFWYRLQINEMESFICNTVHDSIAGEVAPDEVELWNDLAKEACTSDVYRYLDEMYGIKFSVPLAIAYSVDEHWAQGEEIEYECSPDEEGSRQKTKKQTLSKGVLRATEATRH